VWGCLCPITCLFTSWKLLYWTMKETNHSRRYSKGDRLKHGAQMLIKEFISSLKKAPCFLQFLLTCLHYQRSGAFLINCVSSCHLFFHLQYQIPNRPISFQLSVAELRQILLNCFDFGLVWFITKIIIAWKKNNRIDKSCRSQYTLHDYSLSVQTTAHIY